MQLPGGRKLIPTTSISPHGGWWGGGYHFQLLFEVDFDVFWWLHLLILLRRVVFVGWAPECFIKGRRLNFIDEIIAMGFGGCLWWWAFCFGCGGDFHLTRDAMEIVGDWGLNRVFRSVFIKGENENLNKMSHSTFRNSYISRHFPFLICTGGS